MDVPAIVTGQKRGAHVLRVTVFLECARHNLVVKERRSPGFDSELRSRMCREARKKRILPHKADYTPVEA